MLVSLRSLGQALEFIAVALLARRLGPTPFGTLAIGLLIARYGGIIGDWGASVRGVRDVARGDPPAALRALQRRRIAVSIALSLAFVVGAFVTSPAIAPLGIVLVARGTNKDWLSLGRRRYFRAGLPAILQGVLMLTAASLAKTLTEATALIGLGYGIALVVSTQLNSFPPASPGSRHTITDPWLLLATIADQVVASADVFLVGAFLSAGEAGIYAAVYRLPNALQTVAGLIAIAGVPASAHLVARGPRAYSAARRRLLRRAMLPAVLAAASAPVIGALVVPIFGSDYSAGRLPAVLLVIAAAVNLAATPLHPLYLALGNDKAQARLVGGAAVSSVLGDVTVLGLGGGLIAVAVVALAVQVGLLYGFLRGTDPGRRFTQP